MIFYTVFVVISITIISIMCYYINITICTFSHKKKKKKMQSAFKAFAQRHMNCLLQGFSSLRGSLTL